MLLLLPGIMGSGSCTPGICLSLETRRCVALLNVPGSAFLASFLLGSIDNPEKQTVLFAGQPSQGLFFWSEAQDRLVLPFTVPQSLTEFSRLHAQTVTVALLLLLLDLMAGLVSGWS